MSTHLEFAEDLLKETKFWGRVEKVMKWLYSVYPNDMEEIEKEAKAKREANFKDTGASKSNDMRDLALVPIPIREVVNTFHDKDLDKKKVYREFARRYPKLATASKI